MIEYPSHYEVHRTAQTEDCWWGSRVQETRKELSKILTKPVLFRDGGREDWWNDGHLENPLGGPQTSCNNQDVRSYNYRDRNGPVARPDGPSIFQDEAGTYKEYWYQEKNDFSLVNRSDGPASVDIVGKKTIWWNPHSHKDCPVQVSPDTFIDGTQVLMGDSMIQRWVDPTGVKHGVVKFHSYPIRRSDNKGLVKGTWMVGGVNYTKVISKEVSLHWGRWLGFGSLSNIGQLRVPNEGVNIALHRISGPSRILLGDVKETYRNGELVHRSWKNSTVEWKVRPNNGNSPDLIRHIDVVKWAKQENILLRDTLDPMTLSYFMNKTDEILFASEFLNRD